MRPRYKARSLLGKEGCFVNAKLRYLDLRLTPNRTSVMPHIQPSLTKAPLLPYSAHHIIKSYSSTKQSIRPQFRFRDLSHCRYPQAHHIFKRPDQYSQRRFKSYLINAGLCPSKILRPSVGAIFDYTLRHHCLRNDRLTSFKCGICSQDACLLTYYIWSLADLRFPADPFAEAEENTGENKQSQNYIHIRIQRPFNITTINSTLD